MPTPTYTPLANITLSSSAASVTFSSISQAYRDLVLIIATTGSFSFIPLQFNGDSGANYSRVNMQGDGSSATSASTSNNIAGVNSIGVNILNIFDYSATDKHKTSLLRYNDPAITVAAVAQRWASTSAVTSLTVGGGITFAVGSTFALYGIVA